MDIRKIKKMIELLEESGIAEIEIKEGEESLRIARVLPGQPATTYVTSSAPPPPPVVVSAPAPAAAPPIANADAPAARAGAGEHVVTAPMVGTYYAAATPGAKPFVDIGDEVKVGQVLCIIEAMKMMNQIEADKPGRITSVMAKNGDPVEFGQPLFVIE